MSYRTEASNLVRALRADGRGALLGIIAGGGFLTIGSQMIYPVMLPELRALYGLNYTVGGLLLTVLFFTNGFLQFPSGVVADAVGERFLMTASSLACGVSIVLLVGHQSTLVLFSSTALLGVGISGFTICRISLLPKTFDHHLGTAAGLTFGASDAGRALIPAVAGVLAASFVWQMGFAFTVPLFLLVAAVSWYVVPGDGTTGGSVHAALRISTLNRVWGDLQRSNVLFGATILFLFATMWMGFSGFYPEFLVRVKGLSVSQASTLFGALFALGMLVKPISGFLFDSYGVRASVIVLAVISSGGFVVLSQAQQFNELLLATVLISPFLGSGPIGMSMVLDGLAGETSGTAIGVLRTATFSMAALGPVVIGALADRGYFAETIHGLVGLPVLLVLAVLVFPIFAPK